jgi:3-oxoacyl-[acyl-carrier protein] reductase
MNIDFTGKKAIVGGASKGIGRAAAMELAALGASVTLVARGEAGLKTVLEALPKKAGQTHTYFTADTADSAALRTRAADHIVAHGPFHILINNSGGPPAGPAHLAALDDFQKAFSQHLMANHIMMQATLPGMKAAGYGRIINIISTSVKQPIKGLGVSNTIRGAVASWAKTLSSELAGFGITVNNILPGATDTDRMAEIITGKAAKSGKAEADVIADEITHIPAGRFGTPEELAQAIAFLASPAAAYINGINLPVDGGRTGCL